MSKQAAPAGSADTTQPAAKTVQVKITSKQGHRHAGKKRAEDAVISVSSRDAEIIVDRLKVGERVKGE
ncbi:hypothetical protein FBY03_111104 [Pseudomonas sp. SJZ079]|uniref:DUF7210 family protein n=1 Tax=Pseudomonas sp. SJZ079 TaxID=2572887 RepID=UPI00119AB2D3|nr:hypothetical protein [Pseudomonas sp. SJZ079]TWC35056.1 hypothetical protein FBY03_111104 [Pseudomonas sp. SJZ079]